MITLKEAIEQEKKNQERIQRWDRIVMRLIKEIDPRTASWLNEFYGASREELDQMVEKGLIIRVGPGKYTAFRQKSSARSR
jgi:predicted HTH transcriptional regulator